MAFREDLNKSIGSAVVFVLGLVLLIPVTALFTYHIRVSELLSKANRMIKSSEQLLLHNMTTVERLRTKAQIKLTKDQHSQQSTTSLPRNPFQMRWYNNIGYLLCRPAGFDWIEASKPHELDGRLINPGVMCEFQQRVDRERMWRSRENERVDPGYAREDLMEEDGMVISEDSHANELDELRGEMHGSGGVEAFHQEKDEDENEDENEDEKMGRMEQ